MKRLNESLFKTKKPFSIQICHYRCLSAKDNHHQNHLNFRNVGIWSERTYQLFSILKFIYFWNIQKGGSSLIGDFSKVMFLFSNALPKNESENRNNNKRIIHDNNEDIDIKIDTDIDMITVHTADHQLSINLLGKSSLSLYLVLIPPWLLWQWSAASHCISSTNNNNKHRYFFNQYNKCGLP